MLKRNYLHRIAGIALSSETSHKPRMRDNIKVMATFYIAEDRLQACVDSLWDSLWDPSDTVWDPLFWD